MSQEKITIRKYVLNKYILGGGNIEKGVFKNE